MTGIDFYNIAKFYTAADPTTLIQVELGHYSAEYGEEQAAAFAEAIDRWQGEKRGAELVLEQLKLSGVLYNANVESRYRRI